jgi:hypothetical protein
MKVTGAIKAVTLAAVFLIAIALFQVYLIDSFRSDLPGSVDEKTPEVGWCMLFQCEKISYPSAANITGLTMEIGFDAGPEDLKFGEMPAGGGGKRFIVVSNGAETRAKVTLVPFGNISSYIQPKPREFVLESGESVEVVVELKTQPETEPGYYSGGVTLIRLSPKHELMDFLLGLV